MKVNDLVYSYQDEEHDLKEIDWNGNLKCPECGLAGNFDLLTDGCYGKNDEISFLVQCPGCNKIFLAETYEKEKGSLIVNRIFPRPRYISNFQIEIWEISPSFLKIYEQTINAELNGYDTLVGMGLRKSLDYLVSDYLKLMGIKPKITLKDRIEQLDSEDIKPVAHIANWIGNDYTHVETRNEDLTLNDMKTYIHTVVYWMCSKYVSKKAKDIYTERTNKF